MNDEVKFGVGWAPVKSTSPKFNGVYFVSKLEHFDDGSVFLEPCPELTLEDYAAFWKLQQRLSEISERNESKRLGKYN